MTNSKKFIKPLQLISILGIGLLIFFLFTIGFYHIKKYSQKLDLQQETTLLEQEIINKSFAGIDKVLYSIVENKHIKQVLNNNTSANNEANAIITTCNNIANGSITYIMDTLGNVCLSTHFLNRGKQESLLNKNYSFRPYFSKAIKGESVIYSALGITTNIPGIYFSKPIYNEIKQIIGVATIKINTILIQEIIDVLEEKILIINPEGIVFISNEEQWLYQSINPKNQLSIQKLNFSKQFFNKKISDLPFKLDHNELVIDNQKYILSKSVFNKQNWQLVIMTPLDMEQPLNDELKKIITIAFILILIMLLTITLLLHTNRIRKIAKQSISESQEDLRITLESIGDGVISTNNKGIITRLNPIACRLLDKKEEDCLGKSFEQIITLRDEKTKSIIPDPLEIIRNKATNYSTHNIRLLISNSGQTIPVSETASTIGNKQNLIAGYVFVYRDISRIYDLKQKLQENQFHLRKIIDCLPQSIAIVNEEGTLLLNNKQFEKLSGTNAKLLNSKKNTSLYRQSEYFEQNRSINQEVINTGIEKVINEDIYTDTKGENHVFQTVKIAFNYYKHRAVLTVSADISKRKHFQDKLEIAYKEIVDSNHALAELNKKLELQHQELIDAKLNAEQSNMLKTAFLQNISHEIRTPLNGILGFTELAMNEETTAEERKNHAQQIIQSSEQLLTAIEEILEISHIESKHIKLSKKTISPIPFIQEVHTKYKVNKKDNIEFKMDFDHCVDSFSFISDVNILRKIISIIVNNAFKYTHKGEVIIGCHSNQDHITFFVKDSGIGVGPEKQTAVFEHFNQVKESNKVSSGMGLGLTIAKHYTKLIHGEIWLESQLDKGSTFYVKLPVCI